MKVLIAVGKSGGHIFPGLSLASRLQQRLKGPEVFFIGQKDRLTQKVFSKQQYPLFTISIDPLPYKISLKYTRFIIKLALAIVPVWRILSKTRPDVVIGFGGAVSGPVLFISWLRGIPTIIHEQNVVPGRTNRILAVFVNKVALSFSGSERFFNRAKAVLTGNPVRGSVLGRDKFRSRGELGLDSGKFTILVIGGSQGSSRLNEIAWRAFSQMDKQEKVDFQIIHITGENDYRKAKECYRKITFSSVILPFYDKIGVAYSASDLVLARAGAGTISEIMSCGLGSVLVPYPYNGGHQLSNARLLADRNSAILMEQNGISAESLKNVFLNLIKDRSNLDRMAKNSREAGRPYADESLADEVIKLVNK
ncbi:MAG: undecaprenyldiphospho-muramoylpentapeptide beta-N-acetylglucosaminyltransferase [Candidatus Omnitrophota bacterium]|nr:undecaprenyldiphospho-muramoylpentapeptide beta-N-acetylglucosaminyltransferase [Candidatus Omnitrophota bacterium]